MICGLTNFMWSCDSHHSSDFSFRCQSLILTRMALPRPAGIFATTNSLEWKSFRLAKVTFALFGWWCYKINKWIHIFLTIYVAAATDGVDPWKMITRWAPDNIWRGVSTSSSWAFFQNSTIQCCSHFVFCFYGNGLSVCFYLCLPKVMYDAANTTFWYLIWAALQRGVRFNIAWPNDYVDDW